MIAFLAALPLLFPAPAAQQDAQPQGNATGQKPPPIQAQGDFYVMNFEEVESPEGLTLEQFVKLCQSATGINFTYTKETAGVLKGTQLRMFGPKRIPKSDFYSFFQIMMII